MHTAVRVPDASLGFKMLKSEEAKAREAAAKEAAAAAHAASAKQPASHAADADATRPIAGDAATGEGSGVRSAASVTLGVSGKRKRAAAPGGDVDSPMGAHGSATPLPLRTPGSGSSAAFSSGGGGPHRSDEPASDGMEDAPASAHAASAAPPEKTMAELEAEERARWQEDDAEEWGEIASMGRVAPSAESSGASSGASAPAEVAHAAAAAHEADATADAPSAPGAPLEPGGTQRLGDDGEEMDDVDATMAELLG